MTDECKHTYCRLCLCKLEQSEALHLLSPVSASVDPSTSTTAKNLLETINRFLPVQLSSIDGLSQYICQFCHNRIEEFESYINNVAENQLNLEKQNLGFQSLDENDKDSTWAVKLELIEDENDISFDQGNESYVPDDNEFMFETRSTSFECNLCGQLLPTSSGLAMHMKLKHKMSYQSRGCFALPTLRVKRQLKPKPEPTAGGYCCDLCSSTYKFKSQIEFHMRMSHSTDKSVPLNCSTCEMAFNDRTELREHRKTHSRQRKVNENAQAIAKYLKCDLCNDGVTFSTFADLVAHFKEIHDTKGYVRCCDKQFFTRKSVVNHENQHSRPTDFICQICGKLLPNQYSLRDHIARHGDESEKKHTCDICDKRFHLRYDLTDHIRRKHTERKEETDVFCEVCKKKFASKISLYLHNRRFHMQVQIHVCEVCGKSCRSKGDLNSHIKHRHTETEKQKCDKCGVYVKNLQKHLQIHFESTLNIQCQICGHKTTTFKYLRLHMKIHNDDKPYQCAQCGQSFKRKKALDDHMSIHNGIPRHFCNYCDRTFNNSGNKFKHIKQAHPLEAAMSQRKRSRITTREKQVAAELEPIQIAM